MKNFPFGFGALAILLLTSPVAVSQPQKSSDEEAVRGTVVDYIEGYYSGDARRVERSLHPHYLKHMIISGVDKPLRITDKTGVELVQEVRSHGPSDLPLLERKQQISMLDISDDIASVKLVTAHWTDYLTLLKQDGQWKILSVVLRRIDAKGH
jgi:Putative lumazine-binding